MIGYAENIILKYVLNYNFNRTYMNWPTRDIIL